ncbi:hypothetical protein [Okeania sp.]|uniref:hypothetical protein n=1 Tax=Okeania sp. TaxID=3100323 RepID=UPI002B4B0EC8|nr:hypothetical protein [Okeania sp.]MEB3341149.1 hypothetical protein [Okeania sp.]
MMLPDEILEEIYKIREEHAKAFNYDPELIFADWLEKREEFEQEWKGKIIKNPLKKRKESISEGRV